MGQIKKNNSITIEVRNKKYKVDIKNQGEETCTVHFVYNKKHFSTNDFIPSTISSIDLRPALKSIVQREIYDYNKRRLLLSKTKALYGKEVKLMPER